MGDTFWYHIDKRQNALLNSVIFREQFYKNRFKSKGFKLWNLFFHGDNSSRIRFQTFSWRLPYRWETNNPRRSSLLMDRVWGSSGSAFAGDHWRHCQVVHWSLPISLLWNCVDFFCSFSTNYCKFLKRIAENTERKSIRKSEVNNWKKSVKLGRVIVICYCCCCFRVADYGQVI